MLTPQHADALSLPRCLRSTAHGGGGLELAPTLAAPTRSLNSTEAGDEGCRKAAFLSPVTSKGWLL